MKLTIGMAVYNQPIDVFFTLQTLRLYQDMTDVEIVVVDNYGDTRMKDWMDGWVDNGRYVLFNEIVGTTQARQEVFNVAKGEFVLCIDSHVILWPNAVARLKEFVSVMGEFYVNTLEGKLEKTDISGALFHGPMAYDNLRAFSTHMEPVWRDNMWGIWSDVISEDQIPEDPFEIPAHGLGLFGCRKDAWLGFNPWFRGFGGEEGYIHEKFRRNGRQVLCLPFLKWNHKFFDIGGVAYPLDMKDRIRNYLLGFQELGMSWAPIKEHFGERLIDQILKEEEGKNETVG
jgi:glycosyltransferase involved in cell wall biosynthesis